VVVVRGFAQWMRDFDADHVPRIAVVSAAAIRVYSAQVIAQGRP
jgi:hypothetical protein